MLTLDVKHCPSHLLEEDMSSVHVQVGYTLGRLTIQMNNDPTLYKNRNLTHNLQQLGQKANLLSIVTSPSNQIPISSNQSMKLSSTPVTISHKWPGLD